MPEERDRGPLRTVKDWEAFEAKGRLRCLEAGRPDWPSMREDQNNMLKSFDMPL